MQSTLNDWRFTHWLFSYEFEFVKRGLIGEALRQLHIDLTFEKVKYIASMIILLVIASFSFIVGRAFILRDNRKIHYLNFFLFIALISHSATLQHFIYDFARFDSINLVLLIISLLIIEQCSQTLRLLLLPLIGVTMLLVHEASFFLFIPLMWAYWIYKSDHIIAPLMFAALLTIVTFFISTKGLMEGMTLQQHYQHLQSLYSPHVSESSLKVLYRDLDDNLSFTKDSLDQKRLADHVAFLLTVLPFALILANLFKTLFRHIGFTWKHVLLIASCLTPLGLYPLGEDHFRWWAIVITNLTMVISLLYFQQENRQEMIINSFYRNPKTLYLTIFLSLLLGPFGNPSLYPHTINQYIATWF